MLCRAPRHVARRRDGDIAPYRHAARRVRTRGTRGVGPSKEKPKRVTMRTQVRHSLVLRFSGLRKAALPKVGIFDRMGKSIYSNL